MANESNLLVLPKKLGLNKNHKKQTPPKTQTLGQTEMTRNTGGSLVRSTLSKSTPEDEGVGNGLQEEVYYPHTTGEYPRKRHCDSELLQVPGCSPQQ